VQFKAVETQNSCKPNTMMLASMVEVPPNFIQNFASLGQQLVMFNDWRFRNSEPKLEKSRVTARFWFFAAPMPCIFSRRKWEHMENEKDSPSRRVFVPKKLYLMKKIITFKMSVQKYCQFCILDA
jgi:hypothetical protein